MEYFFEIQMQGQQNEWAFPFQMIGLSITAVVSGVVNPGNSSMDNSLRKSHPKSVLKNFLRKLLYLSSRTFIF